MKDKKPKGFGFYFLKHFIMFFMIWVFLAIAVLCFMDYSAGKWFEQECADEYYSQKENILTCIKGHSMDEKQALITLFLPNWYLPFGERIYNAITYIVDDETGEVVGLTDKSLDELIDFIVVEKGKTYERQRISGEVFEYYDEVYYCDKETLKQYLGDLDQRIESWKAKKGDAESSGIKREFQLLINSYYVKGSILLPGSVSIKFVETNGLGIVREEEILETMTYKPQNPTDYEYCEFDTEQKYVYGRLDLVYSEDQELRAKWNAFRDRAGEMEKKIDLSLRNDYYDPSLVTQSEEKYLFFPKTRYYMREFRFADCTGHVYKAVYYSECDAMMALIAKYAFYDIVEAGILITLAFFVCAFLISEWEYRKKRYKYMTEGYRNMLVDSMAHDLKSPLMAISGYAENLKENLKENRLEKSEYYAEKIYDTAGYLNSLITRNLEVLRYDHQFKKLAKTKLDLRKLFEEVIQRHQGELDVRELTVTMEGEAQVKGNEEMLQSVAENLIANCIRHASPKSVVKLIFEKNKFTIQNQTDIIYKGNLKKLWEPFVRGEESRNGKGTGLGLAIVAHILDRHGWKYCLKYDKEKKIFSCEIKIPFGILF